MRQLDVAVVVLQNKRPRALQDAGAAACEPRGMAAAEDLLATGLDADQPDVAILDERIEHAHRVAASTNARDDRRRQPAGELDNLPAGFTSDHRLELAHHQWVRV